MTIAEMRAIFRARPILPQWSGWARLQARLYWGDLLELLAEPISAAPIVPG